MEKIWNRRIKRRRKELGITLEQVAKRLGVSGASAQRYENGIVAIPLDFIDKYAEILQCSPSYLMGWTDIVEDISEQEKEKLRDQMKTAKELERNGITEEDLQKMIKVYEIFKKE